MKNQNSIVFLLVFLVCSFWASCSDAFAEGKVLKSAGCKTEYFLLQDLAESYKETSGQRIQAGKTGNKKAVNLLQEEKIDFAFTCKPIDKLSEKLKLDPDIVNSWKSIPIAKDPIIIVSNSKNGVGNITADQLTELFKGKINNWLKVGGADMPVKTAYMNPELESGVVLLFKEFTVGESGELDKNAMIGDGPSMLGNYVSVTPGGVTFMGFNSYKEKYGDILAIDGVVPTRENILNGTYKLAATYYLTVTGEASEQVTSFIDFSQSPEGYKAIEKNFIPYSE